MKKLSLITLTIAIVVSISFAIQKHSEVLYDTLNISLVNDTPKKILILPLNNKVKKQYLDSAISYLTNNFPEVEIIIGKNTKLPDYCFNGKRYRADSILKFLDKIKPDSIYRIIGITGNDISVTRTLVKNGKSTTYPDRGIFGLGRRPGAVCVISSYRMGHNMYTFAKTVTHEFMHTLGVSHCKHKYCIMQDGNGSGKNMREANKIHITCLKKANIGLSGNSKKLHVLNMRLH